MATNVFGNPVTDEITKEYFKEPITQLKRAKAASLLILADGKRDKAVEFVNDLKERFGNGISVLGLFYNATGGNVSIVTSHDYYGSVWEVKYATEIKNGQWAGFLHGKGSGLVGASAAVVYRGMNDEGNSYDYMCSWAIPYIGGNHAYAEIRDLGHYAESDKIWGTIENKLVNTGLTSRDEWKGCASHVEIANGTTCQYQAILTLKDVASSTGGVYALPPITAGLIDEAPKAPPTTTTTAGIGDAPPTTTAAAAGTDEEA